MTTFWLTFLKFFTVGGMGFGLDMLSTWVLKEKLALKKFTANTLGFIIGIIFRFFANKFWAFEDTNPDWMGPLL
jgi:putative flippase GtrA